MNGLHKFLETKIKPSFDKGGKLEKYYPVYDALETFAFVPGHVTHHGAHIRDGIDMKRSMFLVIVAMIPALLFGMWNVGHQHYLALGEITRDAALGAMFMDKFFYGLIQVLPIIIVSYAAGLGVEFIFAIIKKHQVNEGFLVSGMLIPLIMPADISLWMVAIATIFAVLIGKEVFGGTGMNVLNVALTARAFLFFAYPTKMSGEVWISGDKTAFVDGYTGASALGELATTVGVPAGAPEAANTMGMFGVDGVYSFMNCLLGTIPGSVGETSAIAILIGAFILLFTGIGSWRVMLSFLVGGLAMSWIFNLAGANPYMTIPPMHQIVMGGFMFGMVFMATDPVTAAQTNMGKLIYGFLGGFLSIMIRVFNPAYPEGVMMAILFMNVMAPLIDHYVIQANVRRRMKRSKLQAA
jgi:Na+-transporting NADH:ubiquinone oxidoreductase subunit B